jgi:hypothetical protein
MQSWSGRRVDGELVTVRKEIVNAFEAMYRILGVTHPEEYIQAAMDEQGLTQGNILAGTDLQVRSILWPVMQQLKLQGVKTLRLQHRKLVEEVDRYFESPQLLADASEREGAAWLLRLKRLLSALNDCRVADAARRPDLLVRLVRRNLAPVAQA